MKYLLATILLSTFSATLVAKDRPSSSAVLDRGLLTQAGPNGVLRLDLSTGFFELTSKSGLVYRDRVDFARPGKANLIVEQPFQVLGDNGMAEKSANAVCTTESENVATAATLVTSACAGGQSAFCTSARETLGQALAEFNNCLHTVLVGAIEDGPTPGPQPDPNGQPNPNGG